MREIGVCSWSLRPSTPHELVRDVLACGLVRVQLALDPIRTGAWNEAETRDLLASNNIGILSGMMVCAGEDYSSLASIQRTGGLRPDKHWAANLDAAHANAALAARLGLSLVTLHAGFLPHDPADPLRAVMLDRLREVLRAFAAHNIRVGFETGQEDAHTLVGVLDELHADSPGVNFDPANMILYGMGDPVAAFRRLALSVVQVHIKDARPSATPGEWGSEVPVGQGAVAWHHFLQSIAELRPSVNLVIEREAGHSRIADVVAAREHLEQLEALP